MNITTSASRIRSGDLIKANNERARKIGKVTPCEGKAECIHLDHECYDTRFTTFVRVES